MDPSLFLYFLKLLVTLFCTLSFSEEHEGNSDHCFDDDVYDYQLIEFVTRGPKTNRQTDLVPSFWVNFNNKNCKTFTKFLPPPYTDEASRILHNMIEKQLHPLDSWPIYNIKLIGQASKH